MVVSTDLPRNRDLRRQNKGTSVVDATLFAKICLGALETISAIAQQPSIEIDKKSIIQLTNTCINCINRSCVLFMKSSTYIKQGAEEIAKNEYGILKRSVRFRETDDLKIVMDHYVPCMLEMQQLIFDCNPALGTKQAQITEPDLTIAAISKEIAQSLKNPNHPILYPTSPFLFRHSATFKLPPPVNPGHYYTP